MAWILGCVLGKMPPTHPPRFLYLATHERSNGASGSKVGNKIGDASNPFERIRQMNARGKKKWLLRLVIGPFIQGATKFKHEWQSKSRTEARRIAHGVFKAFKAGLSIYARDPEKVVTICQRHAAG